MSGWKVGPVQVKVGGYAPAAGAGAVRPPPALDPNIRLQQIQMAAQAGDMSRAASLAEAALAEGIEHPMVFNLAIMKRQEEGRFDEALTALRRVIELAPETVDPRNAAGLVLARLQRYREALAMFESVIALKPDLAGAHCARGASLEALGRPAAAEAAYRHALDLEPDNLGAVLGLAKLLSDRGAHAEARPLAEDVLDVEPDFPDAVMVLAAAEAAEGSGADAERRLAALAADARLTPHQRALAQGQLGDVLDGLDRPGEALAAYEACNTTLHEAYAPAYDETATLGVVRARLDELDAIAPEAWMAPADAPPAEATRHVFVVGAPGSGAETLARALAAHPGAAVIDGESLAEIEQAFASLADLAQASEAELAQFRAAYWARARAEGAETAGLVVDHHPLHALRLPLILKLFPQARIVIARRDPRDAVFDAWRRRFQMTAWAYPLLTLPGAAAWHDATLHVADRLEPALAARTFVVGPEGAAAAEISGFLGLDVAAIAPQASTWRRYGDALAPAAATLAAWTAKHGYDAA